MRFAGPLFLATAVLVPLAASHFLSPMICTTTGSATVCSDKDDYRPEETVHLAGDGFPADTSFWIRVTRPDGSQVTGDGTFRPYPTDYDRAVSDADGRFEFDYILDGILGEYLVEVVEEDGTVLATHRFTDAPPKADLDQCRNGATGSPQPCDWVNGNAGASNAHYAEGLSIPYRVVMTNLAIGAHNLTIEYDIRHSSRNAIDYITTNNRIAENTNPCLDSNVTDVAPCVEGANATIPAPAGTIPAASFANLSAGEKVVRIFNGNLTGMFYKSQGSLVGAQSSTRITFNFTASQQTVVIAWGGHIGSSADWGAGNSAGGISGSPYHSRLVALDGVGQGNQDRSLSADAVTAVQSGSLTVVKTVTNDDGGTRVASNFTLYVRFASNGTNVTGSPFNGSAFGTSFVLAPATYLVSEDAIAGYAATIGTDCASNGTVVIASGDVKTCTVWNNDTQPFLTVTKVVVNDNGGTATVANFSLFAGATPVTSGVPTGFDAGTYAVTETGPSGYTATFSGDCDANGSVTLVVGGANKTCTVTNDDVPPLLIVIKTVVNDDGGTVGSSGFTMNVTGNSPSPASFPGAPAPGTNVSLNAGVYSVIETGPAGYGSGFSADCAGTIGVGETKTCTVTNDDEQATLTLVKTIVNDDGGLLAVANVTLKVNNVTVTNNTATVFPANTLLTPTETLDPAFGAYTASAWGGDCAPNGTITLLPGDSKTCTITNDDDAAFLKLVKTIVNDDGGLLAIG
ncbi:MAG: hypothetical protein ACT4PT_04505, partial [Methanobacteriota archaeon]